MSNKETSTEHALLSLQGLSVGDAFGENFFLPEHQAILPIKLLPPPPWYWTDDTAMALSIVDSLLKFECIDQDFLAKSFADRFIENPRRDYGSGAIRLLYAIAKGVDWRQASPLLFDGGSFGNGSAMRIAPLGGFYKGNPVRAAEEAKKAAVITHAHPEGIAGSIAVAVAASIAAEKDHPEGDLFLLEVRKYVPEGHTRYGLELAFRIPEDETTIAVKTLGTGQEVSCQDTVPFCLWVAAYNLENYEKALWLTASGLGDVDTTCAIVGGIVALSCGSVPEKWVSMREPLPDYLEGII